MIVSPTYFGAVADVAALAEVAHARGRAAGRRRGLGRPPALLVGAADRGARVRRRRRALLGPQDRRLDHPVGDPPPRRRRSRRRANRRPRRDPDRDRRARTRSSPPRSTRPGARPRSAARSCWPRRSSSLGVLRERIRAIPGLDVLDERIVGRAGVHAYDPLRLVVDVRGTGATGHRIARMMREQDDINLELFAENVVVAVFGIGERAAVTGARLVEALEHACERLGRGRGGAAAAVRRAAALGPDRALAARGVPGRAGGGRLRRRRGPDRRRVAGGLPARASRTCCRASG